MQATPQIKQFSGFLNTDEVWLDIPEFEGIYQISTLFRVKALNRVVHTGRYGGFRTISERVCATFTYPNGYIGVKLYKKQKEYSCLLHRLIAAAFIPNPENKPCVNHKYRKPFTISTFSKVNIINAITQWQTYRRLWQCGVPITSSIVLC